MERVTCPHCEREHRATAERCPVTGALMPKAPTRLEDSDDLPTEETAEVGDAGHAADNDITASRATLEARSDPGQDLLQGDVVLGRPAGPEPDRDREHQPHGGGADPFQDLEDMRSTPEGVRLALRLPRGQAVPLAQRAVVQLGRDSASPIASVCGDNISRHHAEVRVGPQGPVIVDLGSANGSYLNHRRLRQGEERALRAGDVVQLANDPPLRIEVIASDPGGQSR